MPGAPMPRTVSKPAPDVIRGLARSATGFAGHDLDTVLGIGERLGITEGVLRAARAERVRVLTC